MTDDTLWAPIPGMEGRFEVSNKGDVRSLRNRRNRVLTVSDKGYHTLKLPRLSAGRTWKTYKVHILVLEAFVGPRPEGFVARHLNDDKTDNRVENLKWGTYLENLEDAVRNGRRVGVGGLTTPSKQFSPPTPKNPNHHNSRKTHCRRGHEYAGDNLWVDARGDRYCRVCIRIRSAAHRQK